jgi:hypothetical protein
MHARIEQLLSVRDGEPLAADAATHVASCADCAAAVSQLADLRERLRALPALAPDPDGWRRLQSRAAARSEAVLRRRRWAGYAAAVTLAAVALLAGLDRLETRTPPAVAAVAATPPNEAGLTRIEDLRARSRVLERALATLPDRPAVRRADLALPIEALEAQVQWLDHQLTVNDVTGAAPADVERLWRDRVDVMSSLVELRYVEAQRVVM